MDCPECGALWADGQVHECWPKIEQPPHTKGVSGRKVNGVSEELAMAYPNLFLEGKAMSTDTRDAREDRVEQRATLRDSQTGLEVIISGTDEKRFLISASTSRVLSLEELRDAADFLHYVAEKAEQGGI